MLENSKGPDANEEESKGPDANFLVKRKEVEVVHPWPEWIELMERLGQQNYFDHRRVSEDKVAEGVEIDLSEVKEEAGFDFSRDWTTVRNACMNFGKDRFYILRDVHLKWIEGGNYGLCIEDARGEIWDMVKPADPLKITLADLLACKKGGTVAQYAH